MLTKERAKQYLKDSLQNQSADFKEDQFKAFVCDVYQ